ncbi:MAG: type I-C CRISPR-associated protein Cas5c, partial [bacterium]|nr:type I-C CRISPR-associated protein Cas5c [bacterium]
MTPRADCLHVLEVWSDFACFTRPEFAVERFSYPCPTPSAARGIFESILFKPEFCWQITQIELMSPPSYIALRRNEVKDKVSEASIKLWASGKRAVEPIWADADSTTAGTDQKGRTQRQTMALRSPRFRLHARILPRHKTVSSARYDEQFIRRASRGKCFQQPYLGFKEFVCFFRMIDDLRKEPRPCRYTQQVGLMVYDVFDLRSDNHRAHVDDWRSVKPSISLFEASIESGILKVPSMDSELVL